jgi:hypothetical protein
MTTPGRSEALIPAARSAAGGPISPLRRFVLRADALMLGASAVAALQLDFVGVAFGRGPLGRLLSGAPHAATGFVEAHLLSLLIAALLWRAAPTPRWHLTAAFVHLLLAGASVALWPLFAAAGVAAAGPVTTSLHALLAALQLYALYEALYTQPELAR